MAAEVGVTYKLKYEVVSQKALNSLRLMQAEAKKLASTLKTINGHKLNIAKNEIDRYTKEVAELRDTFKAVNQEKAKLNSKIKGGVAQQNSTKNNAIPHHKSLVENALNTVGRGFLYAVGNQIYKNVSQAIASSSEIDFELRSASAKTGGYERDRKAFETVAQQVGGKTKFNNLDVAQAMNSGASLGMSAEELKKVIPVAANVAQGLNADLNKIVEVTQSHLKTYGMGAGEALKVTDMIAKTVVLTRADVTKIEEGFKNVGLAAHNANIPIEETYAMIGHINNKGLVGGRAGTAINNMLSAFNNISKRDKLEEVIGKVTDVKGNLLPIQNILDRLREKTKNMGNADKGALIEMIFGKQGARAVQALLDDTTGEVKRLTNEIRNSQGQGEKMANYMMWGIGGAMETLTSTMETTFQTLFQSLEPMLIPLINGLTKMIDSIGNFAKENPKIIQLGISLAGVGVTVATGWLAFQKINGALQIFSALSTKAKFGYSGLGLVVLAVSAAIVFLTNKISEWRAIAQQDEQSMKAYESMISSVKSAFKSLGEVFMALIGVFFGVHEKNEENLTDNQRMRQEANAAKDKFKEFKDTMESMKTTFDDISKKFEDTSKWIKENEFLIKNLTAAYIAFKIVSVILAIATAAQTAFNLSVLANPYVWIAIAIIVAITAIVVGIIWLWNNWDKVCEWVKNAWETVKQWLVDKFNAAKDAVIGAFNSLKESVSNILNGIKETVTGWWQGVVDFFQGNKATANIDVKKNGNTYVPGGYGNSLPKGGLINSQMKAVGTNYFQGWKSNGYTTTDEHGDEAIWLPNGSMIARNTTTRDILNTMKGIRSNTSKKNQSKTTTVNHNSFTIHVNGGGKSVADEIIRELNLYGIG